MDNVIQNEMWLKVNELRKIGINSILLKEEFLKKKNISLDLNEMIKVSSSNEGNEIKFETLDKISIVVDVYSADGGWNKVD